jgi:deazaflavin-dependent oxidoreductase (nitroreductase family)
MDGDIQGALERDSLIDITTIGRKSGKEHRIEIAFHSIDGGIYISGMPGMRDWYANVVANPEFTFHLKQSMHADIPTTAVPITDEARRRELIPNIVVKWGRQGQLEDFVQRSPLIEVKLKGNRLAD